MDLANGHIVALGKLFTTNNIGCTVYNLGAGRGTSVFVMVNAFEKASGNISAVSISIRFLSRYVQEEMENPLKFMRLQRRLKRNWVGSFG